MNYSLSYSYYSYGLQPIFVIEENAEFQLEVSENEVVLLFPSKFIPLLNTMAHGSQDKNPYFNPLRYVKGNIGKSCGLIKYLLSW